MGEWPKQMMKDSLKGLSGETIPVIPADLGRELYEALRHCGYSSTTVSHAARAMRRYEQEVDHG